MIWFKIPTIENLNGYPNNGLSRHIGIEYVEVGDDYIVAKMPVSENTTQPLGLLHGGASCVLAESIGSVASNFCIDVKEFHALGLNISTSHISSERTGYVYGKVKAIHIGKKTHIWNIDIKNESGKLISTSQLTCIVKENKMVP